MHREMRKVAYDRVGEPLAKMVQTKLGGQRPSEEPDARSRDAR